ncbi:MAG: hypothetical protein IT210_06685 [Armatimonadetes bacterium]|nr:hypothetical protein [Armatimonadota bacterium]
MSVFSGQVHFLIGPVHQDDRADMPPGGKAHAQPCALPLASGLPPAEPVAVESRPRRKPGIRGAGCLAGVLPSISLSRQDRKQGTGDQKQDGRQEAAISVR